MEAATITTDLSTFDPADVERALQIHRYGICASQVPIVREYLENYASSKKSKRHKLIRAREECNLTQALVAEILNVSENTIYALEQNKRDPSFPVARALSMLFEKPIDYLFAEDA